MKTTFFTKALSALMSGVMLLSLAACSGGEDGKTADNTTAATAPAETNAAETEPELTEAERRALVSDGLPEANYDGAVFGTLSYDTHDQHYDRPEETGEALNDAIFARNRSVEERFNVELKALTVEDYLKCAKFIRQTIAGGDADSFDLIAFHTVSSGGLALEGLYLDLTEVTPLDFSKPWWAKTTTDDLTVNGKCFLAVGDYSLSSISSTWCYLFNKQIAEDNGLDLYSIVNAGEWTMDKVAEIVESLYQDTNGNGTADIGDTYGITSYLGSAMNTYVWACDNPIFVKDADNKPQFVMYSDKYVDLITKVVRLYNENKGALPFMKSSSEMLPHFVDGEAMIMNSTLGVLKSQAPIADFDMGVLPYPKYDTAQKRYMTMSDGGSDALSLSKLVTDTDYVGTILEALCAESYKQMLPVYYDILLKQRYADRPEDVAMMDLVVDGRIYDFGYVYDNFKGTSFWAQRLVRANDTNVASYYAANIAAAMQQYETAIKLFE